MCYGVTPVLLRSDSSDKGGLPNMDVRMVYNDKKIGGCPICNQ